jgi:hypothetical protein
MINPSAAWSRLINIPMFRGMKLEDFRPITFGQIFSLTTGQTLGPVRRDFPGGIIILGISAGSVADDGGTPDAYVADATGSRAAFALSMSYTNDEQITPGGPIQAEALLGGGASTQFPPREIVVAPSQGINVTAENLTSTQILVHIAYHGLVWRFAS